MKTQATQTVEKFRKLEVSGDYKQKLIFASAQYQGDDFEAYIDPNDEFQHADKLSQINSIRSLLTINQLGLLGEYIRTDESFSVVSYFEEASQSQRITSACIADRYF